MTASSQAPRALDSQCPRAGRREWAAPAAILPVIYGLKELAASGWRLLQAAAVAAGLAVGVVFVRRQQVLADPLVDLRLFTERAFRTTLGSMLLYSMLSGATMAFLAQHLQLVNGLPPLRAGLAMVPGMITAIASFQLAPVLGRRLPRRSPASCGRLTGRRPAVVRGDRHARQRQAAAGQHGDLAHAVLRYPDRGTDLPPGQGQHLLVRAGAGAAAGARAPRSQVPGGESRAMPYTRRTCSRTMRRRAAIICG
jgi:hypothetical protein